MRIMQTAVGHMHEERFDRPEDERDDSERSHELPSGDARPDSIPSNAQANADEYLLNHANREAARRKNGDERTPERGFKPHSVSLIDKSVAAGINSGPLDPTDESLFRLYQDGNDEAFFTIYERYKSSIYAYCAHVLFSAGFSREIVEDAFQEVFLRLVQYRHTFTGGEFKPWIFTITRHTCLSTKRGSFHDRAVSNFSSDKDSENFDESRQAISLNEDPLEMMTKSEQIALLIAAIAKLPEEFRQALILSEYEELAYDEIAKILGVSMSTVRIRIFRAKAKLRKMLLPILEGEWTGQPDPQQNA